MAQHMLPFPESKVPKGGEFGNTILLDGSKRPNPHRGADFSMPGGTPIPSATGGTVVTNKWSEVLGWVVVVEDPKGVFWGYCHLREAGLRVGAKVECGDIIGKVGNTGSASHGAHLHWTCSAERDGVFAGKVVDPIAGIKSRIAKEKAAAPAPVTKPVSDAVEASVAAAAPEDVDSAIAAAASVAKKPAPKKA